MRSSLWSLVLCAALALPAAMLQQANGQAVVKPVVKPSTQPATGPATRPVGPPGPVGPHPTTPPPEPPGKTLDECHAQYMKGQYSSSATGYKNLLANETMRLAASIGLSEALEMEGHYPEALDALAKAPQSAAEKDVKFHLQYADVLATVGEYDKALRTP